MRTALTIGGSGPIIELECKRDMSSPAKALRTIIAFANSAGGRLVGGTGLQRVYEQVAEAGLPEPVIEEVMDRVRVTVYVRSHAPSEQDAYDCRHDRRNVGRHDVVMLRAVLEGPLHRNDLLDAAGLGYLAQNYARHIAPMVDAGPLEMTVPDKPRSKDQRYRMTEAGRAFLASRGKGK